MQGRIISKELSEFLRLKISIFAIFFATTGYLLFNPLSKDIALVALSAFFACAAVGSYNNITDREEDAINRKIANPFAEKTIGKLITATCVLMALLFSSLLSKFSLLSSILLIAVLLLYSHLRIKRYLLVKNIYTAFGNSLIFFIGIVEFVEQAFLYYIFISAFMLVGSILSDIRDLKGDKAAGIRTLPVVLGEEFARRFIYIWILAFSILLAISGPSSFFIFSPFALLIAVSLYKNDIVTAHSLIAGPFILITVWQILSRAVL